MIRRTGSIVLAVVMALSAADWEWNLPPGFPWQQIIVAVQVGIATCNGTEEIDAFRLIGRDQAAHHLGQGGLVGRRRL